MGALMGTFVGALSGSKTIIEHGEPLIRGGPRTMTEAQRLRYRRHEEAAPARWAWPADD
jgi:hypothetical protein